jgi:branched-chain amino acid transport system substrate-binding protein
VAETYEAVWPLPEWRRSWRGSTGARVHVKAMRRIRVGFADRSFALANGSSDGFARQAAHRLRAGFNLLTAATIPLALAGCLSTDGSNHGDSSDFVATAPVTPVQSEPLGAPQGATSSDQIGTGPVRVDMILPLTQGSGPSLVGTSLRNAADLALSEGGSTDITLSFKDDQSTPDGARAAAQAAVADNADLILGPLFSPDVRAVASIAQGANKPVIAFSTDASTASSGVYLLSFLIENYVDRIVDYAASRGKRSFAALIPENDYGHVAEAEFQQLAARRGLRVVEIEHYQAQSMNAAVQKIAAFGNEIDTLFIPEQADAMPAMAQALSAAGIDGKKVQILGTGLWNDSRVLSLAPLQGAWFAAPDNGGFNAFAERYRARFNSDPTRIATLGYDSVSLAVALARRGGTDHFSQAVLTGRAGFNGADGVFRFRPNGLNERALAILQINNETTIQLSPAPTNLANSSAT